MYRPVYSRGLLPYVYKESTVNRGYLAPLGIGLLLGNCSTLGVLGVKFLYWGMVSKHGHTTFTSGLQLYGNVEALTTSDIMVLKPLHGYSIG